MDDAREPHPAPTAFVSHFDCSRHDTGWNNPDHQGRLPGLMRAVYRDMLVLHDHLLDLEGRHATWEELRTVHSDAYLRQVQAWVRDAESTGGPIEATPDLRISAASWSAATAAAGTPLTAASAILDGRARNAFCAVRPPGEDVRAEGPGGHGIFNNVALLVRHLIHAGSDPVLLVEWNPVGPTGTREILQSERDLDIVSIYEHGESAGTSGPKPTESPADDSLVTLEARVRESAGRRAPQFIVLAADFSRLDRDDESGWSTADYSKATLTVKAIAEEYCDGRLVSVLEGGFGTSLGAGVVEHLRALAGVLENQMPTARQPVALQ